MSWNRPNEKSKLFQGVELRLALCLSLERRERAKRALSPIFYKKRPYLSYLN